MLGQTVTIATLNIAAASKDRAQRILAEWVEPNSFDVYVFTETSEGSGTELLTHACRNAGWSVYGHPPAPKDRGVVVATRVSATPADLHLKDDPAPGRSLVLDLEAQPPLQLVAMYVPNRGNEAAKLDRKRAFLDSWRAQLRMHPPTGHRLIIGDLNVVPQDQTPVFLPQFPFEYDWFTGVIDDMHGIDLAVAHNAGKHEPTWVAYTGEGYTYDHILVDGHALDRVEAFAYDHTPRTTKISDHSAVVTKVRLDAVWRAHEHAFVVPTQTELF